LFSWKNSIFGILKKLQDALISCTKATISISMKHNFHFGLYIKNVQSFKNHHNLGSTFIEGKKRSHVQYIEVFGHYAVIQTDKDSYRYRSSLKEIIGRLPRGYFAVCHKSYVVNMEHIKSATTTEIIMDSGAVVPIGRTKAQEFNQAFYRFLGR